MLRGHNFYETKDDDKPEQICDRNGEVVLAYCRGCGKAEAELLDDAHCNYSRYVNGIASATHASVDWVKGKYVRLTEQAAKELNARNLTNYWRADFVYRVYSAVYVKKYGSFVYHVEDAFSDKLRTVDAHYFYVELDKERIKAALRIMRPRRRIALDG